MSKVTSFGAATGETVLDSSAEMSAAERSCAVAGVVTCDEMLLSRHHFTVGRSIVSKRPDDSEEDHNSVSMARSDDQRHGRPAGFSTSTEMTKVAREVARR